MRVYIAVLLALSWTAYAQVPRTISMQGVLSDAQGNLISDGNHQLSLKLFEAATGGNPIFTETQTVPVVNGIFNAIIGSVTLLPPSLAFDRAYFLGVNVDGGTELSPRTPLTAVPYAIRAASADVAQALSPTASGAVRSVNGQAGELTIQGAGGTTVTNNGAAFTISSTGSGGTGIQGVQNTDGTIAVQDPSGPVATIGIADGAVSARKINPSGASAGQAIVFNGSNVEWQTVSGGGLQSLQSNDGSIDIQNPTGPVALLAITEGSITTGKIANGSAVRSLNALSDHITLDASGGATISTVGNTITINAGSGSSGTGLQGLQNTDNTLDITNPGGPTATINVRDQGITTAKLADNSVNSAKIQDGQVQTSDVADGSMTSGKLNTATAALSGKVLTATASGMDWQTPAGVGPNYWTANGNNISNTNTGNIGINTTNPVARLHVETGSGAGVFGTSPSGQGVHGHSPGGSGVYGSSTSGNGVLGYSTSNYGLMGESSQYDGIYGNTSAGNRSAVHGFNFITGTTGKLASGENGVMGLSYSSQGYGVYGYNIAGGSAVYSAGKFHQGSGMFEAFPSSTTWASNKPATVKLRDGSKVKLFSEEAAEVYFNDYGEGQLSNGISHISLDPTFLQTVTIDQAHPLKVFVQLTDDCNGVYVTNRTTTGFDVVEMQNGKSDAAFVYRVVCKRKYYEDERLATEEEDILFNTRMLETVWPEVIAQEKEEQERAEAQRQEQIKRSVETPAMQCPSVQVKPEDNK